MTKQSAGILVYRYQEQQLQVFLVHPGGPFWAKKDIGAWTVPKGEFLDDEEALIAAKREFTEETGQVIDGEFKPLKPVKLKSGKTIYCWAIEGSVDEKNIVSNTFDMEWPPRSGKTISVPEVDRADWFDTSTVKEKINLGQVGLIVELMEMSS